LKANAHGGKPIASKQGVYGAALRYAERHGVPRPGSARQRTGTRRRDSRSDRPLLNPIRNVRY
jgi:hypothetical protein